MRTEKAVRPFWRELQALQSLAIPPSHRDVGGSYQLLDPEHKKRAADRQVETGPNLRTE